MFAFEYEAERMRSMAITHTLEISQMSREEKLQTMEAIWIDLSRVDAEVESPAWHQQALYEAGTRVAEGQERIVDWETAKRDLRNRFE